jgi:hypothetical protein
MLRMNAGEAHHLAYVLMSALGTVTMLNEREATTMIAANTLFAQLGYDVRTDKNGNRVEKK